jgi:hypothetical protein
MTMKVLTVRMPGISDRLCWAALVRMVSFLEGVQTELLDHIWKILHDHGPLG